MTIYDDLYNEILAGDETLMTCLTNPVRNGCPFWAELDRREAARCAGPDVVEVVQMTNHDDLYKEILAGMVAPKPPCNKTRNCWLAGGCMDCQMPARVPPPPKKPKDLEDIFLAMGGNLDDLVERRP
jgi:hypothetical protein